MTRGDVKETQSIADEMDRQLTDLADWWLQNMFDSDHGGFFGEVDSGGNVVPHASKGLVLNCRVLWFFSELVLRNPSNTAYCQAAKRAFDFLVENFLDHESGGLVWEVSFCGAPTDLKKQTYGQAFGIYGLVSYARAMNDSRARELANGLVTLLQNNTVDREQGGYQEALGRDWKPIDDVRLSEIDDNAPKTMNTHLHVLEALTSWHRLEKSALSKRALHDCIELFQKHILRPDRHLRLFLDTSWNDQSRERSYGHEIEFSWLLGEALLAIDDESLSDDSKQVILECAKNVLDLALTPEGFVMEKDTEPDAPSVWWVQAEAMVGFLNAYQLSTDIRFWHAFESVWNFVQSRHITAGEWSWFPRQNPSPRYLAGAWKGPYHNGRALMECTTRLQSMSASG